MKELKDVGTSRDRMRKLDVEELRRKAARLGMLLHKPSIVLRQIATVKSHIGKQIFTVFHSG
jgi:hypothetical protein